jgi:hypothetical protein
MAATPANALNLNKKGLVLFDGTALFVSGASNVGTMNLGINYSAGVFTLTDSVGNALSSSNPAIATFQNASSIGQLISLAITNPYAFQDAAGTNEIGANLFGITSGKAWGNDCPFFLYAIINSAQNDVAFGFGRVPHLTVAPASGNLAVAGTTAASTQGSLFLMKKNGSSPTVANFAGKPCVCIGSFRMQATSTPGWTVQSLAVSDGIGNYNDGTAFLFPVAQHGASASTYFLPNGGTAPTFTTNSFYYFVDKNGRCLSNVFMTGDGGTAGSGAVNAQIALPYTSDASGGSTYTAFYVSVVGSQLAYLPAINNSDNKISEFNAASGLATAFLNSYVSSGARQVEGSFTYQMDKS